MAERLTQLTLPGAGPGTRPLRRQTPLERVQHAWRRTGVRLLVLATVVTGGSALVMFLVENTTNDLYSTPWDGLWWAFVTMTTTGYGDLVPKSFLGRLLGVLTMFSGMGLVSMITALIASALVTEGLKEARGLEAIKGKGHILILGWNGGAGQVIEGLATRHGTGSEQIVLVNQLPEESVNEILYTYRDLNLRFVRGDFTQETVLERANVRGASAVIILADTSSGSAIRADERTVLACLTVKHLNPDVTVTGELLDAQDAPHLRRANADEVVTSGEFNGFLMAASVVTPGISQAIRALASYDPQTQIQKIPVPARLANRTFGEVAAGLRQEQGLLTIGIITESKGLTLADVLSADRTAVDEFIQRKFDEAGIELGILTKVGTHVNPPDSYVVGPNDHLIVIGLAG